MKIENRMGGIAQRVSRSKLLVAAALGLGLTVPVAAIAPSGEHAKHGRAEIIIQDKAVFPESVASARDGRMWFSSYAKGSIYLAKAGAATADRWVDGAAESMKHLLGLMVDEKRGLLWACSYRSTGPAPEDLEALIKTFDLRTGKLRATYRIEGGKECNDFAIAEDGTVYTTDFEDGGVLRLSNGDTAFRSWAKDPALANADGIAVLADGIFINTYKSETLLRITVNPDGSPGKTTKIVTSRALAKPDGMRRVNDHVMLLAEGGGRLAEVTIDGDHAAIRTIKDDLKGAPASVALVGKVAWLIEAKWDLIGKPAADLERFGAVAIGYPPNQ